MPKLDGAAVRAVLKGVVPPGQDVEGLAALVTKECALKQLLMVVEMARGEEGSIDPDRFFECIHSVLSL